MRLTSNEVHEVVNSIISGNAGKPNWLLAGTATADAITYSCTQPLPSGAGNIAETPIFRDSGTGDFRLVPRSPCFNKGVNLNYMTDTNDPRSRDADGVPRIQHGTVDMGAYELRILRGSMFSAE